MKLGKGVNELSLLIFLKTYIINQPFHYASLFIMIMLLRQAGVLHFYRSDRFSFSFLSRLEFMIAHSFADSDSDLRRNPFLVRYVTECRNIHKSY